LIKAKEPIVEQQEIIVDEPISELVSEEISEDLTISFVLIAINASDDKRIGMFCETFRETQSGEIPITQTAFNYKENTSPNEDNLKSIVKSKVYDDAGFDIDTNKITCHGRILNNDNTYSYMFSVEVNKLEQTNVDALILKNISGLSKKFIFWISMPDLLILENWQTQVIIMRRMMSKSGMVFISGTK
jgi:hypothetical protein